MSARAAGGFVLPARALMFTEGELLDVWYGGRAPPLTLRLLEQLYATLAAVRRVSYRIGLLRTIAVGVPVVVVGNITAGGTGKTPLAIALVEALRQRGFRPGVASRGYGGSAREAVLVASDDDPLRVGEEPLLIARATQAPVAIGRDRVAAARLLADAARVDVVIADDGLQHYRLRRDVEICVIDGWRRFGNGRLLPAGPLREPVQRAAACDFRLCNGGTATASEIAMSLEGDEAVSLESGARRRLADFTRVHAVAGIGNPSRFFAMLRAAGIEVVEHAFPDHHLFAEADVRFGDDLPVLMTEKDAVKVEPFGDARHWFVPVRARIPAAFFEAVAEKIRPVSGVH